MAQQNNASTVKTPSSTPRLALPLPAAAQVSTPTSATTPSYYPQYPSYYPQYSTAALGRPAGTPVTGTNPAQPGPSTPYTPQQQPYAYGQQAQVYASPYLHAAANYRNSPTPQSPYMMGANTPYSYPTSTQQAAKATTAPAPALALPVNNAAQQAAFTSAAATAAGVSATATGRGPGKKTTTFKGAFTKDCEY